ncbi:hypothetical protein BRC81_06675 [Halobacteriales archaeon QS_1_68_20]|nr:MAG: hypothetical protein BRC81_06675 [Halobacteriales archaeon QS_1_68_20]
MTLRIESTNASPSQYSAEVDVSARNGDGRVDVRLDTYAMGHEASPLSASGPDAVEVSRSTDLDHRLRVGAYRLVPTFDLSSRSRGESLTLVV